MTNLIQNNIPKFQKIIKYFLMTFIVVISIRYIPETLLPNKDIVIIGVIASISYAIMDMVSPTIVIKQKK